MDSLVKEVEKIKIPDDMRKRIIQNCNNYIKSENHGLQEAGRMQKEKQIQRINKIQKTDKLQNRSMKEEKIRYREKADVLNKKRKTGEAGMKTKRKNIIWKRLSMAAALVLCVCITGVTAMAATGKLQGFFKDIKRWDGAVIGTAYEQATEEITVSIEENKNGLSVLVTMVNPEEPPYATIEEFGISSYRIEDMSGEVVVKDSSTDSFPIDNGQVTVKIPLDNILSGNYKLIIDTFVGGSKADQPLKISGEWEVVFQY